MTTAAAIAPAPSRRVLVTICTMAATIMQALDTTIANVALPYMQGSLSASLDQINWVLTSYIVAAAIMTAPIGWLSERFGRKKLFIVCAAGFTVASVLCALAQNIGQMVGFRLLQGMFGAALVPLSQAVMLDSYPPEERGQAMAIWGMGVMLAPIMGPTLGAWLTDNYSWHWVFLINLPIGIVTVIGLILFIDESDQKKEMRFDWFGFVALAVGIGSLQLMLDRGEQVGWFESSEIIAEAIVSVSGFYFFLAHSLTTPKPFIRFALFKDRNFVVSCLFMIVIGIVLFGTMALVTPFLQYVIGYPILTAGYLLAGRGIGTLIAMLIVGRLLKVVEARYLVLTGLSLSAFTLNWMSGFTELVSSQTIVASSIVQGFGIGLVFVPLSAVAFTTLPAYLRTDGASILTLVRNIGSSIGISVVIAQLTSTTTRMHAHLAEYVTPFNNAMQMPDVAAALPLNTQTGQAMMEQIVTQQATVIAYANDFKLLMYLTIVVLPLVFAIGTTRVAAKSGEPAMAID
jgi:DHA2 family multidrug resistance protein